MLQGAPGAGAQHQQIGAPRRQLQRCVEVQIHLVPVLAHGLGAGQIGKEIGVTRRQRQRRGEALHRAGAIAGQEPGIAGLVIKRGAKRDIGHATIGRHLVQPCAGFDIAFEADQRQRGAMRRRHAAPGLRPAFRIGQRHGGVGIAVDQAAAIMHRVRWSTLRQSGRSAYGGPRRQSRRNQDKYRYRQCDAHDTAV